MSEELMKSVTNNLFTVNNLWMMIATALVFIMHLGFAYSRSWINQIKKYC